MSSVFKSKALQGLKDVTVTNMQDQGAPLITKYKCFGPEGYGFILYKNDEKEAKLKEKVVYKNFKGL